MYVQVTKFVLCSILFIIISDRTRIVACWPEEMVSVKLKVRNVSNDIINIIMLYIDEFLTGNVALILQYDILSTQRIIVTTYNI